VLDRARGAWRDSSFTELPAELTAEDVLVVNNTRVFPARLVGRREPSGGRVELLLVGQISPQEPHLWEALARPARRLERGARVSFGDGRLRAEVVDTAQDGCRVVRFECEGDFQTLLEEFGQTPLPPYIKRGAGEAKKDIADAKEGRADAKESGADAKEGGADAGEGRADGVASVAPDRDRERYQTVYAQERGAIAAPTAGLHFTPHIIEELRARGASVVELTLHVGYGTFAPVRVSDLSRHRVAPERFHIKEEAASAINAARARRGRIIAVGTTTVRALESTTGADGRTSAGAGETALTITPGYEFRAVDALLTNFHLPRSSLLVLVASFLGHERTLAAYAHAVAARYRFYSYGDCMLII
jgi:S-adenosylmethionine:tRNA ribosyltransferase-isomerase